MRFEMVPGGSDTQFLRHKKTIVFMENKDEKLLNSMKVTYGKKCSTDTVYAFRITCFFYAGVSFS